MTQRERTGNGKPRPIIVRREEGKAAGFHGGAWKVAYADFVTAMMAFFLVMWLINATTEAQRRGLADYFSPTNLMSHNSSGTGKPFGGETAFSDGAMISDKGAVEVTVGLHPVLDSPAVRHRRPRPPTPPGGRRPGHAAAGAPASGDGAAPPGAGAAAPGMAGPGSPGAGAAASAAANPGSAGPGAAGPGAAGPGAAGLGVMDAAEPRSAGPETAAPGANSPAVPRSDGPPAGRAPGVGPAPVALPNGPPALLTRPTLAAPPPAGHARAGDRAFAAAGAAIRRLVRADPRLAAVASQLAIDITPRGLRIQLLDSRRQAMFAAGTVTPEPPARRLLRLIGPIVTQLGGPVQIDGYTDAAPYPPGAMSNWDLSAGRANAARRVLAGAGLPDARVQDVSGHGDHDLLLPQDPLAPANRRISILVLRGDGEDAAVAPAGRP